MAAGCGKRLLGRSRSPLQSPTLAEAVSRRFQPRVAVRGSNRESRRNSVARTATRKERPRSRATTQDLSLRSSRREKRALQGRSGHRVGPGFAKGVSRATALAGRPQEPLQRSRVPQGRCHESRRYSRHEARGRISALDSQADMNPSVENPGLPLLAGDGSASVDSSAFHATEHAAASSSRVFKRDPLEHLRKLLASAR